MRYFYFYIYPALTSSISWICLLFGAIIGSFLNVCIYRIPEGSFWKNSRSHCRNCGKLIPFYLNIPILSYFILRGKTKCCNTKLSIQYPIVETLTAILFVILYWKYPFIYKVNTTIQIDYLNLARFVHITLFMSSMIIISVIDIHHLMIPDSLSIGMILTTPLIVMLHPDLGWKEALYGILVGGGILYFIAWIYYLVRKEIGLGFGDVKLLAAIGGWLGISSIPPTILIGSITGAVVGILFIFINRNKNTNLGLQTALPFGPFLAFGACIHLLYGDLIQTLLLKIHGG